MSRISPSLREQVVRRAAGRCEYCQLPMEGQVAWFPIDHVLPQSRGGETVLSNLALACPRCNGYKAAHLSARDFRTGRRVRLFHPRRQKWYKHFHWAPEQPCMIRGITPTGRATVDCLQMNNSEIVAIRRLLTELGVQVRVETTS